MIMRSFAFLFAIALGSISAGCAQVRIKEVPDAHKLEISVGGKPFTSYCYGEEFLDKPIFYPVLSPAGTPVNRMYPMVPGVEGESNDHPHHQSLFFTYGNVNGVDYWNLQKSGRRIKQREAIVKDGVINLTLDWIDPKGVKVLEEKRRVTFGGGEDVLWMDHDITLKANEADVVIGDSKEGAFGIRLAETLCEKGHTGRYINAEGLETSDKLWGKPSPWVALTGTLKGKAGDEPVTVAIYSHPTTAHHPPRWHARDYGLFAVNPFGGKSYDKNAPEMKTPLKKGEKVTLCFRVAVYTGKMEKPRLDKDYAEFAAMK